MYMGSRTERRLYKRYQIHLSGLYSVQSPDYIRKILEGRGHFEGIIVDLSEGGLGMNIPHYLPKYTLLDVKIIVLESASPSLVKMHHPLSVSGEIRNVGFAPDNGFRVGMEFIKLKKRQESLLEDLLVFCSHQRHFSSFSRS